MRFWFIKAYMLTSLLYLSNAQRKHFDDEFKNIIIKDIMIKIEKIAESFSKASLSEKPQLLTQIAEKLRGAAMKSFGIDGEKYVELIIQGVKLKMFNESLNATTQTNIAQFKAQQNIPENYQYSKIVIMDHVVKKAAEKIQVLLTKYLINLKSYSEKRVFLENFKKKLIETAEKKHSTLLKDNELTNYKYVLNQSIDLILKQYVEGEARRMLIDNTQKTKETLSEESGLENPLITYFETNPSNTLNSSIAEKNCLISISFMCSNVKSLNKFKCHSSDSLFHVDKLCDGVVECPDKSDERNCVDKVNEVVHKAKLFIKDTDRTLQQNCSSITFNKSSFSVVKDQVDLIIDNRYFKNSLEQNETVRSFKEMLENVSDILNTIILSYNKEICSQYVESIELVASSRKFQTILSKDIGEVLKVTTSFGKSCVCKEDLCVSSNCLKSCQNTCRNQYSLGRWNCPAVNGTSFVSMDAICDGKIDCYDESDENGCDAGKGNSKFKANDAFATIIKNLDIKIASKESMNIRNELLILYDSIMKLQQLAMAPKSASKDIRRIRNRCFSLFSSIYTAFVRNTYTIYESEYLYTFLLSLNKNLVTGLKHTKTGNVRVISKQGCICRNDKCAIPKCQSKCIRVCAVETKLTRYDCEGNSGNRFLPLDTMCNGKQDCPKGEDENNCVAEVCRRHHLYLLRQNIQNAVRKIKRRAIKEQLKFWKEKVTSSILLAEKYERPTPFVVKQMVKEILQDLVVTWGSLESYRKKNTDSDLQEFVNIAKVVLNVLKSCNA